MLAHVHNGRLHWFCEGCQQGHGVPIEGPGAWKWNGSVEAPTLDPSVEVSMPHHTWYDEKGDPHHVKGRTLCHLWLKVGIVQFLNDSTGHDLRGYRHMVHYPGGYGLAGGGQAPHPP